MRRLDDLSLDPALVKLDVQGHDYPALLGLKDTLARAVGEARAYARARTRAEQNGVVSAVS